ncbi:MAG: hypothetical protein R3315_05360 [Woeseiaceae bacterium]|nr:hypothetical protein [Woeseiaceae bacterium]
MRTVLVLISGALLGALLTAALAQTDVLEPTRAAPHIFEQEFENDRVRVLRVSERFGETAPLHHLRDRVVVHVNSCAWVQEGPDGEERMYSYRPGDVYWQDATTRGGKTSNVIQQCHLLMIEVKGAAP